MEIGILVNGFSYSRKTSLAIGFFYCKYQIYFSTVMVWTFSFCVCCKKFRTIQTFNKAKLLYASDEGSPQLLRNWMFFKLKSIYIIVSSSCALTLNHTTQPYSDNAYVDNQVHNINVSRVFKVTTAHREEMKTSLTMYNSRRKLELSEIDSQVLMLII